VIGRYTDRISVQAVTVTNDGGQPVEAWDTADGLYRVAASVETATGRSERVFGAQVQGETTHTVRMAMPTDDIALTSRVLWHSRWGDRPLAIVGKSVTQDARAREVVLACQEARTP
jgi:head-tail adaptor